MTFVFVRVVQTVIVPVAYINSGDTIAIIARKQIAETCSTLGLTVARRFVASIQAIVISVAIPCSWDAPIINNMFLH